MFNTSTGLSESRACIRTFKPLLAPGRPGASAGHGAQHPAPSTQHQAAARRGLRSRCSAAPVLVPVPARRAGQPATGHMSTRGHCTVIWKAVRKGCTVWLSGRHEEDPCLHQAAGTAGRTQRSHVRALPSSARLCREFPRNRTLEMHGTFSGLRISFGCVLAGEPALFLAHPSKHY